MKTRKRLGMAIVAAIVIIIAGKTLAQEPLASAEPVNVAGNWTISALNESGTVDTKYFQLKQDGNTLSGKFKGPNQSGGLEGTINGKHIFIRTKTRNPLTFRGVVDGDTIQGMFHVRGRQGEWHAYRTSPGQ
jgi:hypothetical protein